MCRIYFPFKATLGSIDQFLFKVKYCPVTPKLVVRLLLKFITELLYAEKTVLSPLPFDICSIGLFNPK